MLLHEFFHWGLENQNQVQPEGNRLVWLVVRGFSPKKNAPHTNGQRDVPRCGALSLLQKPRNTGGIQQRLFRISAFMENPLPVQFPYQPTDLAVAPACTATQRRTQPPNKSAITSSIDLFRYLGLLTRAKRPFPVGPWCFHPGFKLTARRLPLDSNGQGMQIFADHAH